MRKLSIIPYIGGKFHLIDNLVPIIEWCAGYHKLTGYLEVCGGGARMLLNLPPTLFRGRLYNDLDLGLCKLFACLQSPSLTSHLIKQLLELGYNEDNFYRARDLRNKVTTDLVTSAAYTFLVAHQSRAACMQNFDKISHQDRGITEAHYSKKVLELRSFHVVLGGVDVTNGNALDILEDTWAKEDYFCYIDTPYPQESKISRLKSYEHDTFDYARMVDTLLDTKMKVMLSGYADNNLHYARLNESNGWHKIFVKNVFVASSCKAGIRADEYIWVNFDIPESILRRKLAL